MQNRPGPSIVVGIGAIGVLDVVAIYAYSLGIKEAYPPGHPWSGLSLVLLLALGMSSARRVTWLQLGLTVASAGLWTFAAITNT